MRREILFHFWLQNEGSPVGNKKLCESLILDNLAEVTVKIRHHLEQGLALQDCLQVTQHKESLKD